MINKLNKDEMLDILAKNTESIDKKTFNVYFYVVDSEGYPNGMLEYIYQNAMNLMNMGYNVTLLYNSDNEKEHEFGGVGEWLGEAYDEIPRKNVNTENVNISACDFLFIPEFSANVMIQTKSTPCKRVMILQSRKTLCEAMPIGVTPFDLKIYDCIVPTESLKEYVYKMFPGMNVHVVRPEIKSVFRASNKERRLIVNLMSKDRNVANRIIKTFYWKYPIYKWVTFRDLRGVPQEGMAESLMDGAISVWADDSSEFGLPILQSLKCGSITFAKVPDVLQEWMVDDKSELIPSIVWFDDIDVLADMLASTIRTWTLDGIDDGLYEDMKTACETICSKYTNDEQINDIKESYLMLFEKRRKEFDEVKKQVENNVIK